MIKQNLKEFSFCIILFVSCVITFATGYFSIQHNIGYVLFGLSLTSFFISLRLYRYVLGISLLIGLINFATFTPFIMHVGFKITFTVTKEIIELGIQPFSAILLAGYFYVYKEKLMSLWAKAGNKTETDLAEAHHHQVALFKRTFANKSSAELQAIVNENERVAEALQAARELLEERE